MSIPVVSTPAITTNQVSLPGEGDNISPPLNSSESNQNKLSIHKSELIPITVRIPDREPQEIEISSETKDILIGSVAYNLEYIYKLATSDFQETVAAAVASNLAVPTREAHLQTYLNLTQAKLLDVFRLQHEDLDFADFEHPEAFIKKFKEKHPEFKPLSEKTELYEALQILAAGFMQREKGKAVITAKELMDWEAASLQAASGSLFVKDRPIYGTEALLQKGYLILSSSGLKEAPETPGQIENWRRRFQAWSSGASKPIIGFQVRLVVGDTFDSSKLDPVQRKFLELKKWSATTALTPEEKSMQKKDLDQRLKQIAIARTKLYTLTDFEAAKIELNFIKDKSTPAAPSYIDHLSTHFLGEEIASDILVEITQAGERAAEEIMSKTNKELQETYDKSGEVTAAETTTGRIDAEIRKKTPDVPQAEQVARTALINAEIEALTAELTRLLEYPSLQPRIEVQTKKLALLSQQIVAKLPEINNKLGKSFNNTDELIKYLTDASGGGLKHFEQMVSDLTSERDKINRHITELESRINTLSQTIKNLTRSDRQGNLTNQNTIAPYESRNSKYNTQIDQLQTVLDSPWAGKYPAGNQETITELIVEAENEKTKINNAVNEVTGLNALITEFNSTTEEIRRLESSKTASEDEMSSRTVDPKSADERNNRVKAIREEIKNKEEEKANIGVEVKDLVEIAVLKALKTTYESSSKTARENRLAKAERTALRRERYDLAYDPEWQLYPPAVIRALQLIWGDEILMPNPADKDLLGRLQILMKSKKYLGIITGIIEQQITDNLPAGQIIKAINQSTFTTNPDSPLIDSELASLFAGDISIMEQQINNKSIIHLVNRGVIDKILGEMTGKSLNITVVQT